jgi:hypothetical protein
MKETYKDLDVTVIYENRDYSVSFECYEIVGHIQGKTQEFDVPLYELKGWKSSGDETNDISKARTMIRGFVKWDGCSHYYFSEEDNGYLHLCGGKNIGQIGQVIKKIYDRCGELMKEHVDKDEFSTLN